MLKYKCSFLISRHNPHLLKGFWSTGPFFLEPWITLREESWVYHHHYILFKTRILHDSKGFSTSRESSDAQLLGYYMDCNNGQTAFYTFTQDLTEGISAMFWFRPKLLGNALQTLFALQGNSESQWSLALEYLHSSKSIQLRQSSGFTLTSASNIIISGNSSQY